MIVQVLEPIKEVAQSHVMFVAARDKSDLNKVFSQYSKLAHSVRDQDQ
jgi:hypothetical protein